MCGLCGNFDGNANNDFMKHDGEEVTDPVVFGNSWKSNPGCPDVSNVMNPCEKNPHRSAWAIKQCSIITSPVFSDCHSRVSKIIYLVHSENFVLLDFALFVSMPEIRKSFAVSRWTLAHTMMPV